MPGLISVVMASASCKDVTGALTMPRFCSGRLPGDGLITLCPNYIGACTRKSRDAYRT